MKYFPGNLPLEAGYMIEAINGVPATYDVDKSYWQIRTQEGPTPNGKIF